MEGLGHGADEAGEVLMRATVANRPQKAKPGFGVPALPRGTPTKAAIAGEPELRADLMATSLDAHVLLRAPSTLAARAVSAQRPRGAEPSRRSGERCAWSTHKPEQCGNEAGARRCSK
jgi:hypothetical protein